MHAFSGYETQQLGLEKQEHLSLSCEPWTNGLQHPGGWQANKYRLISNSVHRLKCLSNGGTTLIETVIHKD